MSGHHFRGFLDPYCHGHSAIHRLSTGVKLAAALAIILSVAAVPPHTTAYLAVYTIAAIALATVAGLSHLPAGLILRRILCLEPFVLGIALLALLQPSGGLLFLTLVVRSTLCIATMVLLANTTPFAELLKTLRRARVPKLLLTTMALMYRYLLVIVDQSQRMGRARAARTFTNARFFAWRSQASLLGHLFARTTQRAERIYDAMCARGWQ